jgi:hypothetical protein
LVVVENFESNGGKVMSKSIERRLAVLVCLDEKEGAKMMAKDDVLALLGGEGK